MSHRDFRLILTGRETYVELILFVRKKGLRSYKLKGILFNIGWKSVYDFLKMDPHEDFSRTYLHKMKPHNLSRMMEKIKAILLLH